MMTANDSAGIAVAEPLLNGEATKTSSATAEAAANTQTQSMSGTTAVDLDLPTSAANGLIQRPFAKPLETSKPLPPAELTPEQQSKYEAVLKTVSSWTTIPQKLEKNAPTAPITDDERMWLTRDCLLRYLRATKWNVPQAEERLRGTLTWRREYGMERLTADYISIENETGKQVLLGYDIHSRPCLYLLPSNQNTERSDRQVEHLVYMIERVIDLLGPNQETMALLINFKESSSGQNASIGQAKQTLYILQNHYPERLGRALIINGKRTANRADRFSGLTCCSSLRDLGIFQVDHAVYRSANSTEDHLQ